MSWWTSSPPARIRERLTRAEWTAMASPPVSAPPAPPESDPWAVPYEVGPRFTPEECEGSALSVIRRELLVETWCRMGEEFRTRGRGAAMQAALALWDLAGPELAYESSLASLILQNMFWDLHPIVLSPERKSSAPVSRSPKSPAPANVGANVEADVVSALVNLGYRKREAVEAVACGPGTDFATGVRKALALLSKKCT
jgi:hypothetical protein